VIDALNEHLAPIRARRSAIAADPRCVQHALSNGNRRARAIIDDTLDEVRTVMHMRYE
jgi:tryptophanyl-tRNA synthetase